MPLRKSGIEDRGLSMTRWTRPNARLALAAWVFASTASVLLAFLIVRMLVDPAGGKANPVVSSVVGVAGIGLLLPLAQWGILRQFLPKSHHWIVASLAGVSLGLAIDLALSPLGVYPIQALSTLGASIAFGIVVGTAQWMYLRRYLPHAILWIVASALGWGLMTVTTGMVVEGLLEQFLFGLIPALSTGLALVYFMHISYRGTIDGREVAA